MLLHCFEWTLSEVSELLGLARGTVQIHEPGGWPGFAGSGGGVVTDLMTQLRDYGRQIESDPMLGATPRSKRMSLPSHRGQAGRGDCLGGGGVRCDPRHGCVVNTIRATEVRCHRVRGARRLRLGVLGRSRRR